MTISLVFFFSSYFPFVRVSLYLFSCRLQYHFSLILLIFFIRFIVETSNIPPNCDVVLSKTIYYFLYIYIYILQQTSVKHYIETVQKESLCGNVSLYTLTPSHTDIMFFSFSHTRSLSNFLSRLMKKKITTNNEQRQNRISVKNCCWHLNKDFIENKYFM